MAFDIGSDSSMRPVTNTVVFGACVLTLDLVRIIRAVLSPFAPSGPRGDGVVNKRLLTQDKHSWTIIEFYQTGGQGPAGMERTDDSHDNLLKQGLEIEGPLFSEPMRIINEPRQVKGFVIMVGEIVVPVGL